MLRKWMMPVIAAAMAMTLMAADAPKMDGPAIGTAAPDFKLDDQSGNPVKLSDYKGKIIVLEWINRDCPIDKRVLDAKTMVNLWAKYKDKGIAWLAIDSSHMHTKADLVKTREEFGITYPVLDDSAGVVGHAYGATNTPHMFIIDKEGKLAYKGAIDDDPNGKKTVKVNYVDVALTELLEGKSVTTAETKPYGCSVKYAQ